MRECVFNEFGNMSDLIENAAGSNKSDRSVCTLCVPVRLSSIRRDVICTHKLLAPLLLDLFVSSVTQNVWFRSVPTAVGLDSGF